MLEFLLENHPLDCPVCDKGGECPLQDRTFRFGPGRTRFVETKRHFPKPLDLSSLIALDRERCISCYRCVRFSQDVAEDKPLIMEDRGAGTEIATFTGDQYEGRFTGNVIDLCPVGRAHEHPVPLRRPALGRREHALGLRPDCPVGVQRRADRARGRRSPASPAGPSPTTRSRRAGSATTAASPTPATAPPEPAAPRRSSATTGRTREASLDDAVDAAALVLRHGGRVGILVGPTATVEEGFLAQELAAGPWPARSSSASASPATASRRCAPSPAAQLGDIDARRRSW